MEMGVCGRGARGGEGYWAKADVPAVWMGVSGMAAVPGARGGDAAPWAAEIPAAAAAAATAATATARSSRRSDAGRADSRVSSATTARPVRWARDRDPAPSRSDPDLTPGLTPCDTHTHTHTHAHTGLSGGGVTGRAVTAASRRCRCVGVYVGVSGVRAAVCPSGQHCGQTPLSDLRPPPPRSVTSSPCAVSSEVSFAGSSPLKLSAAGRGTAGNYAVVTSRGLGHENRLDRQAGGRKRRLARVRGKLLPTEHA